MGTKMLQKSVNPLTEVANDFFISLNHLQIEDSLENH
jgi:hypothetical protein